MKALILAEKPSVGRDIAKALHINTAKNGYFENNNYIVTWALGHLVTNATPEQYDKTLQQWRMEDLPILPKYMKTVVINKTRKQFNTVQHLMKRDDVKQIIIATDAGREGELVARLIIDKARVQKQIKRLWISSVTTKAIRDGFKHLKDGKQYDNLYQAALARSEADWIVGINATRALTTKYDAQLSLGRVQTPTIQLIHLRQQEIKSFKPQDYFTLSLTLKGVKFDYQTNQRIMNRSQLDTLVARLKDQQATITSVESKQKKTYPSTLFNLTDLQQAAYQRYHLGAKQTLNTLQQLYERHKLVTYPRTDSNYLTTDMVDTLKERLQATMGTDYRDVAKTLVQQKFGVKAKYINNQKVSDHHAIIPTEVRPNMSDLTPTEQKVYLLIVQRFLEVLSPPYRYIEQKVVAQVGDATFVNQMQQPVDLGFKRVQTTVMNHEQAPTFEKGERLKIQAPEIQTHQTTPPPYFNEGTLLKAMERPDKFFELRDQKSAQTLKATGGIGTVATRADIIDKLYTMNAIENQGGNIKVTSKGRQILELAPETLTSPLLTAEWEDKLLRIEKGQLQRKQFIGEMKEFTRKIIQEIKSSEQKYKHDNLTSAECPTCGKFMLRVKTKNGSMLVCQDPSCKTKKDVKTQTKARCPQCKKRLTKFGTGKRATYRCSCGYTETQEQMDKRFKNKGKDKVSKREMKKYMKDEQLENNPFKEALKGLKG
ncbi:DNA topoisomerase III [Staphylococcus americanisciuri]|uniref:DNA topoisomerase 3 n=1 Tax=Staphylococcus americanisciuri TaxID=2973940 RepID=A0ABT2F0Y4_9STAP|nr:DNA topoisomerase III [Staphylococcus americanisciuri]MCS4486002.1 DNA topoisomerase III [Staphylococcus americanisciuri]